MSYWEERRRKLENRTQAELGNYPTGCSGKVADAAWLSALGVRWDDVPVNQSSYEKVREQREELLQKQIATQQKARRYAALGKPAEQAPSQYKIRDQSGTIRPATFTGCIGPWTRLRTDAAIHWMIYKSGAPQLATAQEAEPLEKLWRRSNTPEPDWELPLA